MYNVNRPLVCNYGHLKMWAERGLIHWEDTRSGEYESMSCKTCLERMQGLQDMLKNSRIQLKNNGLMDFDRYDQIQRMIEQMIDVVRQAQEQGMPSDPTAVRDLQRRMPCTVVVPDVASMM